MKRTAAKYLLVLHSFFFCMTGPLFAQSRTVLFEPSQDPRGETDLTVCSQNLFNHGTFKNSKKRLKGLTKKKLEKKRAALSVRIFKADCDIVAFQEAIGKVGKGLEQGMQELVDSLRRATNREFKYLLGDGVDRYMRVGFLYATDRVHLEEYNSFRRIELPRLVPDERPQLFPRAPLAARFKVKSEEARSVILINMHFKSKAKSDADPAQLDWETTRMQMSEAVRRVVLNKYKKTLVDGNPILMVLGDRNSHFDSASAAILEGRLRLADFQKDGDCRLSKTGVPLCKGKTARPQILFSVLTGDPQLRQLEGTHNFKGKLSWLDDILMSSAALRYAEQNPARKGDYFTGVIYEPRVASDHALIWVKLNW